MWLSFQPVAPVGPVKLISATSSGSGPSVGSPGSQLVYVTGSPDAQTQSPSCARSLKPMTISPGKVADIQRSSA
jgi:hypothetical protein